MGVAGKTRFRQLPMKHGHGGEFLWRIFYWCPNVHETSEIPMKQLSQFRPNLVARAIRTRFARIDSREPFANETPISIARRADSHESLEFPIRANHATKRPNICHSFSKFVPSNRKIHQLFRTSSLFDDTRTQRHQHKTPHNCRESLSEAAIDLVRVNWLLSR